MSSDLFGQAATGPELIGGSTPRRIGTAQEAACGPSQPGVMVDLRTIYGDHKVVVRATKKKRSHACKAVVAGTRVSRDTGDEALVGTNVDGKQAIASFCSRLTSRPYVSCSRPVDRSALS